MEGRARIWITGCKDLIAAEGPGDDADQVTWPAFLDSLLSRRNGWTYWLRLGRPCIFMGLSKNHPDQVIIVSFEDFLRDMDKFVRDGCRFLNFSLSDSMRRLYLLNIFKMNQASQAKGSLYSVTHGHALSLTRSRAFPRGVSRVV